jgi:hypothetical protein
MHAFRCRECGDTRWSLLGSRKSAEEQGPCQLCGGEVTRERRTPSVSATPAAQERREAPQGSPAAR